MSAKDLKASIYKLLESTDDEMVLEDVHEYISQRKQGIIPELGCTLDEYNRDLEEAVAEIERGETVSHEEVMASLDEMFKQLQHERQVESPGRA
jgi:hypothetical protein